MALRRGWATFQERVNGSVFLLLNELWDCFSFNAALVGSVR